MLGGVPAAFGQVSCADQADATMRVDCTAPDASDAVTAGSLAIGEGAMVEAAPDIEVMPAVDAMPGVYNLTYNGETFMGATGNLTVGQASTFMYEDENGDMQTLMYLAEMDDELTFTVVTEPVAMVAAVPEMRQAVNNGTAIGANLNLSESSTSKSESPVPAVKPAAALVLACGFNRQKNLPSAASLQHPAGSDLSGSAAGWTLVLTLAQRR